MDFYNNGEDWKPLDIPEIIDCHKIFVSSHGNVKSYKIKPDIGHLLKQSTVRGYKAITFRKTNGKRTAFYVHRMVSQHFLEKPDEAHKYVIHIDHDKQNNHVSNLQWVTKQEREEHQQKNPKWRDGIIRSAKLNESKVRLIKEKIFDPNRKTRMKMIAKQFGISENQLYLIKSGKHWGHVEIGHKKK